MFVRAPVTYDPASRTLLSL